jgi:DNA-binding HxlR family transcriptional regulator
VPAQPSDPPQFRSACAIARSLDVMGDRWSLIVVRDLMFTNKRTYSDLASSQEGIPTNILADRLRKLESWGLINRTPYQEKPVRYAYGLTDKGEALRPALLALNDWGKTHFGPGTHGGASKSD